ncbi:MAG: FHA domain-containing protein [Planctomycetota bacterium]|jgi:pSer/pThr/pTyr-binding forkhead associated (FHA) protein
MDVKLVLVKNNGRVKSFPLANGINVLGRRHDCDLRIPLMSVSRRHCRINLDNGNVKIRDLDSMNGTSVNGATIDETELKAGDNIKIGPLSFVLQIDGAPNEFATLTTPKEKTPSEEEPQGDLSDILDAAITDSGLDEKAPSKEKEDESEELDFLLNED